MSLCCRYGGSLILFLSLLRCPDSVFYSGSYFSPPVLSLFLSLLFLLSSLLPFLPCLYTWHLFCFPFLCSPCLVVFFLCHCSFSFCSSAAHPISSFAVSVVTAVFCRTLCRKHRLLFCVPHICCTSVRPGTLIALFLLRRYPSSPPSSSFSGLIRLLIYRMSFFISSRISNFAVSSVSSV